MNPENKTEAEKIAEPTIEFNGVRYRSLDERTIELVADGWTREELIREGLCPLCVQPVDIPVGHEPGVCCHECAYKVIDFQQALLDFREKILAQPVEQYSYRWSKLYDCWLVEGDAASTIAECQIEEDAERIVDALNASFREKDVRELVNMLERCIPHVSHSVEIAISGSMMLTADEVAKDAAALVRKFKGGKEG